MKKIKDETNTGHNTVYFNHTVRELCKICKYPKGFCRICKYPKGFCKHTIEKEYKELCPDTPLTKRDVWQLVRSHAIKCAEYLALKRSCSEEITSLRKENLKLKERLEELEAFYKRIVAKIKEGENQC